MGLLLLICRNNSRILVRLQQLLVALLILLTIMVTLVSAVGQIFYLMSLPLPVQAVVQVNHIIKQPINASP